MPRFGSRGRLVLLVLLVGAFATIVGIQRKLHPVNSARRAKSIRYIPGRNVLKLTSFGYRRVYADLLWIQAIQYLATPFENADAKYEWLDSVFDAITDLDPRFISAYRLGASWLTMIKRDGPAGIRLLEKGIRENPDRWELPHDIAMIHFVDRRDRPAAIEWLKVAVAKPACPLHVRSFWQYLMVEKDEGWAAISMWLEYLDQNRSEIVRNLAEENLCKLQCQMIRRGIEKFETEEGRRPTDLLELLASAHLPRWKLMDGGIERFETKNGRRPASLGELVESGLVPRWIVFDLTDGVIYEAETGKVWSSKLRRIQVKKALYILRTAIALYEADQGRAPRSLEELQQVIRRPPRHPRHKEGWRYGYDAARRRVFVVEPEASPDAGR